MNQTQSARTVPTRPDRTSAERSAVGWAGDVCTSCLMAPVLVAYYLAVLALMTVSRPVPGSGPTAGSGPPGPAAATSARL